MLASSEPTAGTSLACTVTATDATAGSQRTVTGPTVTAIAPPVEVTDRVPPPSAGPTACTSRSRPPAASAGSARPARSPGRCRTPERVGIELPRVDGRAQAERVAQSGHQPAGDLAGGRRCARRVECGDRVEQVGEGLDRGRRSRLAHRRAQARPGGEDGDRHASLGQQRELHAHRSAAGGSDAETDAAHPGHRRVESDLRRHRHATDRQPDLATEHEVAGVTGAGEGAPVELDTEVHDAAVGRRR